MTETTSTNKTCSHQRTLLTLYRLQVDEYSVAQGQEGTAERYLDHLMPVHEIRVHCSFCGFDETYAVEALPLWVKPLFEKVKEAQRQEKLAALLEEMTEPIDLSLLDDLLDAEVDPSLLIGKMADWHGETFPIVQLANERIAIHVTLTCSVCHQNPITAYVGSGLHSGAFCYVYSYEGEYQANLRDQNYICQHCQEKRTSMSSST